jgi:hypothetical protein
MPADTNRRGRFRDGLLVILFLGSLWGAVEAVVGGALHHLLPPTYPGHVMLAVAMALLAYAVRKTGAPWVPLGMALVAAPLKLTSGLVYALPATAPEVLNPALAILGEGAAVAALSALLWRADRPGRLVPIAALAAVFQAMVWVGLVRWVGMALYPPGDVLAALGAKLAPGWAMSLTGMAGVAFGAAPIHLAEGLIGGAVAATLPRPRPVQARPLRLAAGTALCLAICFVASWTL